MLFLLYCASVEPWPNTSVVSPLQRNSPHSLWPGNPTDSPWKQSIRKKDKFLNHILYYITLKYIFNYGKCGTSFIITHTCALPLQSHLLKFDFFKYFIFPFFKNRKFSILLCALSLWCKTCVQQLTASLMEHMFKVT